MLTNPDAINEEVVRKLNAILIQTTTSSSSPNPKVYDVVSKLRDRTIRLQYTEYAITGLPFLLAQKFLEGYEK